MSNYLRLGKNEVVADRPFASPDHIIIDNVVLRTMIDEIHRHLLLQQEITQPHVKLFFPTEQRWHKRILLTRPQTLRQQNEVTVVGFFGKVNPQADSQVHIDIQTVGQKLCDQLLQMPAILAYYTWLLADELNYANLVVLKNREAIEQWRHTVPHTHAKDILSPKFYDCVRIYNGRCLNDPHYGNRIIFESVKYWDYRATPTWFAVRDLEIGE